MLRSALKQRNGRRTLSKKTTKPHEYAIRFLFGGLVTTATLIAKHEKLRKREAGYDGTRRGRAAAAVDARGTSLGALALTLFGLIVWKLLPTASPSLTLLLAASAWATASVLLWHLRRKL